MQEDEKYRKREKKKKEKMRRRRRWWRRRRRGRLRNWRERRMRRRIPRRWRRRGNHNHTESSTSIRMVLCVFCVSLSTNWRDWFLSETLAAWIQVFETVVGTLQFQRGGAQSWCCLPISLLMSLAACKQHPMDTLTRLKTWFSLDGSKFQMGGICHRASDLRQCLVKYFFRKDFFRITLHTLLKLKSWNWIV